MKLFALVAAIFVACLLPAFPVLAEGLAAAPPPIDVGGILAQPLVQLFLVVVVGGAVKSFLFAVADQLVKAVRARALSTPDKADDVAAEAFAAGVAAFKGHLAKVPDSVVSSALKRR